MTVKKWLGLWWCGRVRFFADEGDAGGGAGADVADVVEDTAAGDTSTNVDESPWYKAAPYYKEEDDGIWSKYKTAEDALKSIPHKERMLSKMVELPADDVDPEARAKAISKILGKLGAPKKVEGYKEVAERAMKDIPDSVLDALPEGFIDRCCEEAHELGYLPHQFEKHLAMAMSHIEGNLRAQQDARDAADKEMKRIFGHRLGEMKGLAEKAASMFDDDMFREENAKLPPQERAEKGGLIKRMLIESQDPHLYRLMAYLHDRLFSEGDGPIPSHGPGKVDDAYTRAFKDAQSAWPNRGREFWEKYANEIVKGTR